MDTLSPAESQLEAEYLVEVTTLAATWARRMLLVEDVDDIAQDVTLDCLAMLRAGRPMPDPRARNQFVRGIVRHRVIDDLRSAERRIWRETEFARELEGEEHLWMSPEKALDDQELQHVIALTIDAMPPRRRQVYLLASDEGATDQSVGALLDMQVNTIHQHANNARRQLRAALSQYFGLSEVVSIKRGRPRTRPSPLGAAA